MANIVSRAIARAFFPIRPFAVEGRNWVDARDNFSNELIRRLKRGHQLYENGYSNNRIRYGGYEAGALEVERHGIKPFMVWVREYLNAKGVGKSQKDKW